jgi:hypothetical protein
MATATIKRDKGSEETYSLSFKKITKGELLSLKNALKTHATISVVGQDMFAYLENAFINSGEHSLKEILED